MLLLRMLAQRQKLLTGFAAAAVGTQIQVRVASGKSCSNKPMRHCNARWGGYKCGCNKARNHVC